MEKGNSNNNNAKTKTTPKATKSKPSIKTAKTQQTKRPPSKEKLKDTKPAHQTKQQQRPPSKEKVATGTRTTSQTKEKKSGGGHSPLNPATWFTSLFSPCPSPSTSSSSSASVSGGKGATLCTEKDRVPAPKTGGGGGSSPKKPKSASGGKHSDISSSSSTTIIPSKDPAVRLNVYGLTAVNRVISYAGMGVYHSGVEVYGIEWAFGGYPEPVCSIYRMPPRDLTCLSDIHGRFHFVQSLPMGKTKYSLEEIYEIVGNLGKEWIGTAYHMIYRNCNCFSDTFIRLLCSGSIPPWVNRPAAIFGRFPFLLKMIPEEYFTPKALANKLAREKRRKEQQQKDQQTKQKPLQQQQLPAKEAHAIKETPKEKSKSMGKKVAKPAHPPPSPAQPAQPSQPVLHPSQVMQHPLQAGQHPQAPPHPPSPAHPPPAEVKSLEKIPTDKVNNIEDGNKKQAQVKFTAPSQQPQLPIKSHESGSVKSILSIETNASVAHQSNLKSTPTLPPSHEHEAAKEHMRQTHQSDAEECKTVRSLLDVSSHEDGHGEDNEENSLLYRFIEDGEDHIQHPTPHPSPHNTDEHNGHNEQQNPPEAKDGAHKNL